MNTDTRNSRTEYATRRYTWSGEYSRTRHPSCFAGLRDLEWSSKVTGIRHIIELHTRRRIYGDHFDRIIEAYTTGECPEPDREILRQRRLEVRIQVLIHFSKEWTWINIGHSREIDQVPGDLHLRDHTREYG